MDADGPRWPPGSRRGRPWRSRSGTVRRDDGLSGGGTRPTSAFAVSVCDARGDVLHVVANPDDDESTSGTAACPPRRTEELHVPPLRAAPQEASLAARRPRTRQSLKQSEVVSSHVSFTKEGVLRQLGVRSAILLSLTRAGLAAAAAACARAGSARDGRCRAGEELVCCRLARTRSASRGEAGRRKPRRQVRGAARLADRLEVRHLKTASLRSRHWPLPRDGRHALRQGRQ
jgi:hypothetical protein